MDADVLLTESDQGPDKYHILVVDDSKLQRKILLNWLQGSFHVSEAESGEQAFELLLSHKINLALVDVEMPGMNGFQLLERIKHTPELDHLPVIRTYRYVALHTYARTHPPTRDAANRSTLFHQHRYIRRWISSHLTIPLNLI